jgi:N-glycosylase/DNA lyase
MTPSTPPEERDQREKTVSTAVESIKTLEEECAKLYEDNTKVWNQLSRMLNYRVLNKRFKLHRGRLKD